MDKNTKQKRFTLSLPDSVHEELNKMADAKGITSRDVIIKSLKLGMIAFQTEQDPSKELLIREHQSPDQYKETLLVLV